MSNLMSAIKSNIIDSTKKKHKKKNEDESSRNPVESIIDESIKKQMTVNTQV